MTLEDPRSGTFSDADGQPARAPAKFVDPDRTVKGDERARVRLSRLETLWINTGTLCNITCQNCYIHSSPTNDALLYITAAEAQAFFDEARALGTREIGFTGGEPFMNPDFLDMLAAALEMGFEVLVLTNAMQPMQRRGVAERLLAINARHGARLTLRVSLDHFTKQRHEEVRGPETWSKTIEGLDWLSSNGFRLALAGRSCWQESDETARAGFAALIAARGWPVDANDRKAVVIFPEMEEGYDGPEISTACWGILKKSPDSMMCAHSRMVVKRKGAGLPVVVPCTLLPYDQAFEMGATLAEAAQADGGMFEQGAVKLCHRHCAKFCVLGGGSCS